MTTETEGSDVICDVTSLTGAVFFVGEVEAVKSSIAAVSLIDTTTVPTPELAGRATRG